jgi:predicted glycoside hydrolase/deacetylase ChbG (UPF0249 family)
VAVIVDDFGMAPGVDRAVVELARAGRLTGTSVLALGSHWPVGARWLRELPGLQVGLHVDLPPGHDALGPALLRAWSRRLKGSLADHLEAQFDAFEQHHGRRPDYLDGHRHVHQWPQLRDLILEHWSRRYTTPPGWARITRPARGVPQAAKAHIVHRLGGPAWEQRLRRRGIASNVDFLGVYDFSGGSEHYGALLRQWLACAGDGSLLMCHPAAEAVPDDVISAARLDEYQVWRSAALGDWLQAAGCTVLPGEMLAPMLHASVRTHGLNSI